MSLSAALCPSPPRKGAGRPRIEDAALLAPSTERVRKHRRKKADDAVQELHPPLRVLSNMSLPAASWSCPSPPRKGGGRPRIEDVALLSSSAERVRKHRRKKADDAVQELQNASSLPAASCPSPQLAEAQQADNTSAEADRRKRQIARALLCLADVNHEGRRGLKLLELTLQLEVKSGDCICCLEETSTFTPCCGVTVNSEWPPKWLCKACVKKQQQVYTRDPVTSNDGRMYQSGHLRHACPHCRKLGAFSNGARALWRTIP